MRTIFVLFDSLNRTAIGAYGGKSVSTPNFDHFAKRAVTFDNHYVGSLPCMPARRDMHTGRLNFMHRHWGPLEPFDNSYAKLLSQNGVYSHIISDHLHYFEDGGAGYATAFDSWEFIRGQEYDPLKVMVEPPIERLKAKFDERHYPLHHLDPNRSVTKHTTDPEAWTRSRHAVNTLFMNEERDFPTAKCFEAAFGFLETNKSADNWFLQLECFDPHEPFTAPARFKDAYQSGFSGKILDWPVYEKVTESAEEIAEIRGNYAALVAMCDEYFGKLLDWMDEHDAWGNTNIILSTDHGFLLGEHEWWAKSRMPYYEEVSHIPLMIWHPDSAGKCSRTSQLTQTTDLMPTLLDFHGVEIPDEVTSHSLVPALMDGGTGRESAILGMFGGPICVTDKRYTYYLFPADPEAKAPPLYTVMPSHMSKPFTIEELKTAEMSPPFDFTKGAPLMRINMDAGNPQAGFKIQDDWGAGSALFDLENDPTQAQPLDDDATIERLSKLIVYHLVQHNAPSEIYTYYGFAEPASSKAVFTEGARKISVLSNDAIWEKENEK